MTYKAWVMLKDSDTPARQVSETVDRADLDEAKAWAEKVIRNRPRYEFADLQGVVEEGSYDPDGDWLPSGKAWNFREEKPGPRGTGCSILDSVNPRSGSAGHPAGGTAISRGPSSCRTPPARLPRPLWSPPAPPRA